MIIKYKRNLFLYVLLAAALGAAAGAVVSLLLYIMNIGIRLVWDIIPGLLGSSDIYNIIYTIGVCLLGGLLIGLWQRKFGIYPQELEEVMHELKSTGSYPYDRIHVIAVAALLPLIFGGCLGPEAGLTGIIAGLCCMIGDRLKYKGREIREMAEAGMAATLGVVFNSPFIGIAFNYESGAGDEDEAYANEAEVDAAAMSISTGSFGKTEKSERNRNSEINNTSEYENSVNGAVANEVRYADKIKVGEFEAADTDNSETIETEAERIKTKAKLKKLKLMVYVVAVAAALGMMKLISMLLGSEGGIPRFGREAEITVDDWKWFIIVFAAGLVAGIMYAFVHKATLAIGGRLINHRVLSCMIAGALLAMIGLAFPQTMFSGEHQMGELMETWQSESAAMLILTSLMKLLLVNLCIDLGWKGGSIFPVIFSGVSMGYAMAMILGIEPIFAVAVCTAALCGYTMRKPIMAIGVLLLCFPVTVIIPLSAAAYLGSIIPSPAKKE